MKIILVGNYTGRIDEGIARISEALYHLIASEYDVIKVNTADALSINTILQIKKYNPDIIHYIPGPTIRSLLILKVYKAVSSSAITIASGTRPYLNKISRKILPLLRPEIYLSQAGKWEKIFKESGAKCYPFPNCININKFSAVNKERQIGLRNKYAVPLDKIVLLHVGHIKENRNLEIFLRLAEQKQFFIIIVGSKSYSNNIILNKKLLKAGIKLITEYTSNIEELYQLADVYVFPVKAVSENDFPKSYNEVGVIDFPLSILEAMSTNLPVITTPLETLKKFLGNETSYFKYFDGSFASLLIKMDEIHANDLVIRNTVTKYDCNNIAKNIISIYNKVLSEKQDE